MKFWKLSLLAVAFPGLGAFAQVVPTVVAEKEGELARAQGVSLVQSLPSGGGPILFQETFSNGFDGSNGNGAWTVEDNANDSLWAWVMPGGQGMYADGSATGTTHPGGEYSTNIGALASPTADDGWMIFDNDFYNTPIAEGYQDTDGSITSPVLDFTSYSSVIVDWHSYFRYCCYPYAPIYLEVGSLIDGVTNWTSFDAHGSFIESANTASANPLPVSVDVSCVAANQDSVFLRFAYRQAPETGNAYSHYYWGIDDVTVTSNDVLNDIEITQVTNGDVSNVWEYRVTPLGQAIRGIDGGLVAGVMYRNVGTENQNNVQVSIDILDESGGLVASAVEFIDVVYSFANAATCPANAQDTLFINTGWEPDAEGSYTLQATMVSGMADATPANNVLAKQITYSDAVYAHDSEDALDAELRPRESDDIDGFYDPTGQGSFFHTPNSGAVAYGLAIRFGANSGLTMDGVADDLEFETRLYTLDGSTGITDSPYEAAYWVYDHMWSNPEGSSDVEVFLPFDDPINLETWEIGMGGNYYFAAVMSEYESATELTVQGQANSDTDYSTGTFGQAGDGSFVWFTRQTFTPAVRLILAPWGCQDPSACNYQSGPSVDGVECDYDSCLGCTDVSACNYDAGASVDDGTCDFSCFGCTDSTAVNWDPIATVDDGSCLFFVADCSFIGDEGWEELEAGLYSDTALWHYTGVPAAGEWVLSMPSMVIEPASGSTFVVDSWTGLTMSNLPPGLEVVNLPETVGGGEQNCVGYAGVPTQSGLYPILVSGELTVSVFGNPYSVGVYNVVGSLEISANPNPIPGCTYGNAANYLAIANQDDGSCEFAGCMEPTADNYQALATVDDGSCEFDNCVSTCPGDLNGDGTVGTPDLLSLLSSFGIDCD